MSIGMIALYMTPTHTCQKAPFYSSLHPQLLKYRIKLHFVAVLIRKMKWNILTADESKIFGLVSQT